MIDAVPPHDDLRGLFRLIEHQHALKERQSICIDPPLIAPMPVAETAAMFFCFVWNAILFQPTGEDLITLHMV